MLYKGWIKANFVFDLAMNAQMRSVDLICKLIGPLFIASIDSASTKTAICVNFGLCAGSVIIECFSIAQV
jgi:iron-regulated transporter 1